MATPINNTTNSKILELLKQHEYNKTIEENKRLEIIISLYRLNEQQNNIKYLNLKNDLQKMISYIVATPINNELVMLNH